MISSIVSRLVILVFGTLYPAYASYKAVRTKNVKEYVKWMMYWIVFALFTCAETFTDVFLSFWFPFYYEIKIILVLWLLSPATKGSSILYRKFVHPMLSRREQDIDEYIAKAKEQGYHTVLHLGTKGVNYATTVIMQTAIKGGGGLVQQLRRSYSLSDLSTDKDMADVNRNSKALSNIPDEDTDEADEGSMDPRMLRPRGYSPRRSASGSGRVEMYFPEVDVDVRQHAPRQREPSIPLSHIRSSEDVSSGYSSAEPLYAGHHAPKGEPLGPVREPLMRTASVGSTRSMRPKSSRSGVVSKRTPTAEGSEPWSNEEADFSSREEFSYLISSSLPSQLASIPHAEQYLSHTQLLLLLQQLQTTQRVEEITLHSETQSGDVEYTNLSKSVVDEVKLQNLDDGTGVAKFADGENQLENVSKGLEKELSKSVVDEIKSESLNDGTGVAKFADNENQLENVSKGLEKELSKSAVDEIKSESLNDGTGKTVDSENQFKNVNQDSDKEISKLEVDEVKSENLNDGTGVSKFADNENQLENVGKGSEVECLKQATSEIEPKNVDKISDTGPVIEDTKSEDVNKVNEVESAASLANDSKPENVKGVESPETMMFSESEQEMSAGASITEHVDDCELFVDADMVHGNESELHIHLEVVPLPAEDLAFNEDAFVDADNEIEFDTSKSLQAQAEDIECSSVTTITTDVALALDSNKTTTEDDKKNETQNISEGKDSAENDLSVSSEIPSLVDELVPPTSLAETLTPPSQQNPEEQEKFFDLTKSTETLKLSDESFTSISSSSLDIASDVAPDKKDLRSGRYHKRLAPAPPVSSSESELKSGEEKQGNAQTAVTARLVLQPGVVKSFDPEASGNTNQKFISASPKSKRKSTSRSKPKQKGSAISRLLVMPKNQLGHLASYLPFWGSRDAKAKSAESISSEGSEVGETVPTYPTKRQSPKLPPSSPPLRTAPMSSCSLEYLPFIGGNNEYDSYDLDRARSSSISDFKLREMSHSPPTVKRSEAFPK